MPSENKITSKASNRKKEELKSELSVSSVGEKNRVAKKFRELRAFREKQKPP